MKICPNCGENIGLFGAIHECPVCRRTICKKCSEFYLTIASDHDLDRMQDFHLCSEDCAFNFYIEFIRRAKPPIVIENDGNVGFTVHFEKPAGEGITFTPPGMLPRNERFSDTLNPRLVPLYNRIKSDLESSKIVFKETFMAI